MNRAVKAQESLTRITLANTTDSEASDRNDEGQAITDLALTTIHSLSLADAVSHNPWQETSRNNLMHDQDKSDFNNDRASQNQQSDNIGPRKQKLQEPQQLTDKTYKDPKIAICILFLLFVCTSGTFNEKFRQLLGLTNSQDGLFSPSDFEPPVSVNRVRHLNRTLSDLATSAGIGPTGFLVLEESIMDWKNKNPNDYKIFNTWLKDKWSRISSSSRNHDMLRERIRAIYEKPPEAYIVRFKKKVWLHKTSSDRESG